MLNGSSCTSMGVCVLLVSWLAGCSERPAPVSEQESSAAPVLAAGNTPAVARNVAKTREERVQALRRVLAPRLNRSTEGLEEKALPNGKKMFHLDGRFSHAVVLRKNADGSRERGCFDQTEPAVRFMTEAAE